LGGNFWQGAAAGLFSSFGGSISGGLGITDFWCTVAVTAAMGGVGAAFTAREQKIFFSKLLSVLWWGC